MKTTSAPTSATIRDALENEIFNGNLAPGTRLDEVRLAERFGVSRTPVREALRFLAATGLVDLVRNRGASVAEVSVPRLIEMLEVMAEFEAMCGRLCARRVTNELSADLLAAHEACRVARDAGDADEYYYCNEAFHDVLYEGCGNSFLKEEVTQLRRRVQPYRRLQLQLRRRRQISLDEHQIIVDAITAGDEAAAERSLRDHLLIQGERFADFIALIGKTAATGKANPELL